MNGEASTKGAGNSVVTAANGADVSGGCTKAVELVGHLNIDGKFLLLGLGETEGARHVVGYLQGSEGCHGIASLVHVALERSSSISIDLVDGDCQGGASRDFGHATSGEFVLSLLANIDVTGNFSSSASIDNVLSDLLVANDSGILLARRDGGAVTGKLRVDCSNVRTNSMS